MACGGKIAPVPSCARCGHSQPGATLFRLFRVRPMPEDQREGFPAPRAVVAGWFSRLFRCDVRKGEAIGFMGERTRTILYRLAMRFQSGEADHVWNLPCQPTGPESDRATGRSSGNVRVQPRRPVQRFRRGSQPVRAGKCIGPLSCVQLPSSRGAPGSLLSR